MEARSALKDEGGDVPHTRVGTADGTDGPDGGGAGPEGIGRVVGGGVLAMVLAAVAGRVFTLGSQMALGFLLSEKDFGIFAIAVGASAVVQMFRDGGMRFVLQQRGHAEYENLRGPIFWMSLVFNIAAMAALAAASPLIARSYNEASLVVMLLVMAAMIPASTPLMMWDTKLRVDLRFAALSKIAVWSALVRNLTVVAAALVGAGPMSMVWAMLAANIFESVASYALVREKPWTYPTRVGLWGELFRQGKYAMLQVLAVALIYQGPYLAAGLVVPAEVLGVYFWAFAILSTTGHMLVAQVENVLMPSVVRLAGDVSRQAAAARRSVRALALMIIPICVLIGAVYAPLEKLIWGAKWAESVRPVQIMAVSYPLFALHVVARSLLMSRGKFMETAWMLGLAGVGLVASAFAGAHFGGTALSITLWTSAFAAVAGLTMLWYGLRGVGVSVGAVLSDTLPVMGVMGVMGAGVLWLDETHLSGMHPFVRCAICGVLASGSMGLAGRFIFRRMLVDILGVLPARLGALGRQVLLLREV